MKVNVLITKCGQVREVEIPERSNKTSNILNDAYHYGQNDFQPKPIPSVSCGDVVCLNGENHMVAAIGFRKMETKEFSDLEASIEVARGDEKYPNVSVLCSEMETRGHEDYWSVIMGF